VGDIVTTITVDVEGAGSLDALADAAERAAAAVDKLDASLGKGLDASAGAAGMDKMAADMSAALSKIQAQVDALDKAMADIGKAGAGGDAGAASLAKIGDAAKGAAAEADAMAASVGRADDTLKGLGGTADTSAAGLSRLSDAGKAAAETTAALKDTSAGAADGLKGIGAGADLSAAQMAEFNKVMADSAAMQAQTAKVSADASLAMARSSQVQADAKTSLGTTSVEQDAAMAQSAKSAKLAQEDAAASAEASASKHETALLAVAAAAGYGIYKAAQLQTQVTRLYTTAGESQQNLPMITQGILGLSGQTNTSQAQLAQGAYWVESAGFHGQSALNILKAVAEGSQSEGAPLQDVANATTSLMNAYGMKGTGPQAMQAVNQMLAVVGEGKMTMAQLATALPAVLPLAASHAPGGQPISFSQVGGALATMTGMGYSAQWGAQHLSHTIGALQNPNQQQSLYMQQFGLNPNELAKNLGSQGLTGTLSQIQTHVLSHMGKSGMVMLKAMNQASSYLDDANRMLPELPKSVQGIAQQYEQGKVTAAQWQQEMFKGGESGIAKADLEQFGLNVNKAHQFNPLLAAGQPAAMAYQAAISKIMGGSVGEQTFMSLMGEHLGTFKDNVNTAGDAVKQTGSDVKGWSQVQDTLNFKIGSFEKSLEAVATEVGGAALPAATDVMKGLSGVAGFLASNPELAKVAATAGGVLGAGYLASKVASPVMTGLHAVGTVAEKLNIPGLSKLANIGQDSGLTGAATGLSGAAGSLEGAAGSLEGAAAALKGEGAPGSLPGAAGRAEGAAAAGEGDAAAAAEGAGGAGIFAKIFGKGGAAGTLSAMAGPVMQGIGLGLIIKGLGDELAPKGSAAGNYNAMFQRQAAQGPGPASQLHPNVFGGFEGWMTQHIGQQVGGVIDSIFGIGKPSTAAPSNLPAAPRNVGVAEPGYGRFGPAGLPYGSPEIKPKIMPPDLSGFTAQLAQAMHLQPVRMPPPDLSAMNAAKSQISAALMALSAVHPAPIKIPAPDLSALNAAKGQAQAAGSAAGAGFAAGVASETGAAAAAGAALAAAAESAMKVHLQISSPSKVTEKIGEESGTGLAKGLTEASSAVKSAAAGLAQNAAGTIKAATASIGSDSVASLLQGLQGGQSNQQNATAALYGALANPDAVTTIQQTIQQLTQDIPAGKDTGLVRWLGQQQTKLDSLANRQGALMAQISDAQQAATQQISASSITGAGAYTPAIAQSGGPQSAQSTITGMGYMSADTQQFAAQLAQLQKMGLNATSLSQLAQGGATAGLPITEGLVSGGKGAIAQINALEAKIIGASKSIGTTAGPAMYQSGLQVTDQLAQGLKDELAQVDKEMTAEANAVIKAVQKVQATASSSSSSSGSTAASSTAGTAGTAATAASTAGLGKIGPAASGAASGLSGVASAAASAAAGLSGLSAAASGAAGALGKITAALTPAAKPGSGHGGALQPMGGGGSAGGGTTTHVTHVTHVHVAGSVIAQQDLADHIQTVVLAKNSDNWQAGLVLPGRAL